MKAHKITSVYSKVSIARRIVNKMRNLNFLIIFISIFNIRAKEEKKAIATLSFSDKVFGSKN